MDITEFSWIMITLLQILVVCTFRAPTVWAQESTVSVTPNAPTNLQNRNLEESSNLMTSVKITNENGSFYFGAVGSLHSNVRFAHIRLSINISTLEFQKDTICNMSDTLYAAIKAIHTSSKLPSEQDVVLNEYFKVLISPQGNIMHAKCIQVTKLVRLMTDLFGFHWNTQEITDLYTFPTVSSATNRGGRRKRQLGIVLGITAVIGSLLYGGFSIAELAKLSAKTNQLEEIDNHIVEAIDTLELKVQESNRMITALNHTVVSLADELTLSNFEIHLNALAARLIQTQDLLIQDLQSILEGLTDALGGKFSHKLMPYDDLQVALTSIKRRANSLGLGLPMQSIRNIFEQSLSYAIFASGEIELYIHIPLTNYANEFKLHILHPTPIFVSPTTETDTVGITGVADGTFWTIQNSKDKLLAISKDGTNLFEIDYSSLQLCNKVGSIYFCKQTLVRRRSSPETTCLGSIYKGLFDGVKKILQTGRLRIQGVSNQLNTL